MNMPIKNHLTPGHVAMQTPAQRPTEKAAETLAETAMRGAQALLRMRDADRDVVMGAVPGMVSDIATQLAGSALENRLVQRNKAQLTRLIMEGTSKIATATTSSASRVGDLRSALTAESSRTHETAEALARIAAQANVEPKSFEQLVGRLELLAELQGERKFAMISNRELKTKIMQLTNGNLAELAANVGRELAVLAYEPVRRLATAAQIV